MIPLYTCFRWWKLIYRYLYRFSSLNHEKKIFHKMFVHWLKFWDFFFLLIPLFFLFVILTEIHLSNDYFKDLLDEPPLNSLFDLFVWNSYLYTALSLSLFASLRIYRNGFRIYRDEKIFAYAFHKVNHEYRNCVNEIIDGKKENSLYRECNVPEDIKKRYALLIKDLCSEAKTSMEDLINDPRCYISIMLLVTDSRGPDVVTHYSTFPSDIKEDRKTYAISKENVPNPRNLFQLIINRFNEAKKQGDAQLWDIGVLINDLSGCNNIDYSIPKDDSPQARSVIILPITIDFAVRGFFCFYSMRVGYLREKHRHLLSGYCDVIANVFRNILP